MAEAALKERLPPLRKDTLDWRDMIVVPEGARALGAEWGGAGKVGTQQDAVGGSVT